MTERRFQWMAAELESLARPVAALREDPENARRHSEQNLSSIAASLRAHGQRKPIVVKAGVVIAGNGTLRAARALGWTHLAAVEYEGPEAMARAFALADNRSAELAEWDDDVLARALREADAQGLLGATSFDRESADAAIAAALGKATEPAPRVGADQTDQLVEKFVVLVECESEPHQLEVLDRLQKEGLLCRALVS